MDNRLLRDLQEVKASIVSMDKFRDDVLYLEFDHERFGVDVNAMELPAPARHDALLLVGIIQGELTLSVDYITHRMPQYAIGWIMPTHISQPLRISQDFRCWLLRLSRTFLEENGSEARHNMSMILYMQLKKYPFCIFEEDEFLALHEDLLTLRQKMQMKMHLFQQEVVINSLKAFQLNMGNFFFGKKENVYTPVLTRKEELFGNFLTLLTKRCKEEHEVSFYAEQLCITPQYLSRTLKEQSGRSAGRWIQDALMVEAKSLLKMPRVSVQEVARQLHFPDQSTFGKFFKKHAGISPAMFRKA
jgi:AraC-like DNA-binding protein